MKLPPDSDFTRLGDGTVQLHQCGGGERHGGDLPITQPPPSSPDMVLTNPKHGCARHQRASAVQHPKGLWWSRCDVEVHPLTHRQAEPPGSTGRQASSHAHRMIWGYPWCSW